MRAAGFTLDGLDAGEGSLLDAPLPPRVALVLGNETDGFSDTVRPLLDGVLGIRSTTTSSRWEWPAQVPWRRSSWPAGVTDSADQYCTCVTGAPAACRDGR